MTVKELIDALVEFGDDTLVVLAKDAEGNGFSPLAEYSGESYIAETSYSGELADYEDEDQAGGVPAVVLWPIN